MLPKITINTSPTDYEAVKVMRNIRFDGERWDLMPAAHTM
jgi:hypothetical protein